MQETQVRSLRWEDPLETEMATHSSTLAWKIPWTEESGRLQSMGSQRVRHDWATSLSFTLLTGRTDAEVEAAILWPSDGKSQLIGKDPDAGKDSRQKKGLTEDVTVGSHHWFNGHELEPTVGDSEEHSLTCCSPCYRRVVYNLATEQY